MSDRNMELIKETIEIINAGWYPSQKNCNSGHPVKTPLKLTKAQMSETIILTDGKIRQLVDTPPYHGPIAMGRRCGFTVSNNDSFAAAIHMSNDYLFNKGHDKLLVLNFANPEDPGGGVRGGAKAQEEDLCRKSTLLASLESTDAKEMYEHNRTQSFVLSSDYMILTPNVEIFRDENDGLLKESILVSVLSAAAPDISDGFEGISMENIEEIFYKRIMGVLQVATTYEYKHLVLGAWGCGAFGNDANLVARLFYKAFKEIRCGKFLDVNSLFRRVEFAILDNSSEKNNIKCFEKYFSNFYSYEDESK